MAMPPDVLAELSKMFNRFGADENDGERQAAFNRFVAILRGANANIRDFAITPLEGSPEIRRKLEVELSKEMEMRIASFVRNHLNNHPDRVKMRAEVEKWQREAAIFRQKWRKEYEQNDNALRIMRRLQDLEDKIAELTERLKAANSELGRARTKIKRRDVTLAKMEAENAELQTLAKQWRREIIALEKLVGRHRDVNKE